MRRTAKTTLPFAFCLFCAVVGLVLVVVGLPGALALRDARASVAERAAMALESAIAPTSDTLRHDIDPVVRQLYVTQRWASSGLFPEIAMRQWPSTLIPAIAEMNGIQRATLAKENGAYWQLVRSGDSWTSHFDDNGPGAGGASVFRWSDAGDLLPITAPESSPIPSPLSEAWFRETLDLQESASGTLFVAGLDEIQSGSPMTLAVPLQFPSGQRGALCVELNLAGTISALEEQETGIATILLDIEGKIAGQLQDAQTRALVQERAIPASSSPALDALLNPNDLPGAKRWFRASAYTFAPGEAAWIWASVDEALLPTPALPIWRYLGGSLAAGLLGALVISLILGRKITAPLRQVASRAKNIQALDEHYLPWPESRFTEVNSLTTALEGIYESAVEHLDYHDAPLVVWAQPDEDPEDDSIVVDAVRHVMNIPRTNGKGATTKPNKPEESAIPVNASQDGVATRASGPAAAQLQVLHGTRREVRRLQGQLAGASEELRTTGARFEEGQERMRRQRTCLRAFHKALQSEGVVSLAILEPLREALSASRLSLWVAGEQRTQFRRRLVSGLAVNGQSALNVSRRFRALLEEESCIAVCDPRNDSRVEELLVLDGLQNDNASLMLVPVKFVGQLLGFLLVEHAGHLRRWKSDEELFATSIAAQCAGTLWHQLRQQARAIAGAHLAGGNNVAPAGNGNLAINGIGSKWEDSGALSASRSHPKAAPEDVIVWETDLAGCIKRIQGDVEAVYGRSANQLLGQPVTFLSDAIQGQRDLERLSALLAGSRCTGYKTRHLASDGLSVDLHIDGEVLRDANDRIVGARGTARCLRVPAGA